MNLFSGILSQSFLFVLNPFCIIAMQSVPAMSGSIILQQPEYFMKISTLSFLLILIGFGVIADLQAQDQIHKVKSGETLSQLARKYKTSVEELIRLNPESAKGLKLGASLRLPGSSENRTEQAVVSSPEAKTHKVVSGESLSRIAKKYKVSVADLEKWNNMTAKDLKAGQELQVSGPGKEEISGAAAPKETTKEETSEQATETQPHVVFKGETLSSIAEKEGTTVAVIRKLNQLKNDQLKLGQVLLVPKKAAVEMAEKPVIRTETEKQLPPPATRKEIPPAKPENTAAGNDAIAIPPSPQVNEIPSKQDEKPMAGIREVNNTLGYTRVVETGFGEAIEGDGNSKKHLCLHKSAPVGSILQVKNEVNGQSVFVKVIGKLPETGSNEKIIIRISRQAYERLMATGKRFPVEVSYPEAQQ